MIDNSLYRLSLVDYLTENLMAVIEDWMVSAVAEWHARTPSWQSFYVMQAKRLLTLYLDGARCATPNTLPLSPEHEATLRHAFPLVYSEAMVCALAESLTAHFRPQLTPSTLTRELLLDALKEGFAASSPALRTVVPLHERLERLNRLSWQLSGLHDRDSIIDRTLTEAPRLVEADACLLWPWDMDQQAPTMMVASQMCAMSFPFSEALLTLLRRACAEGGAFTVDPAAYTLPWPAELYPCPALFVPLLTQRGCLGILSVHHYPDEQFTQEDLLLLSALGNLVATALVNAQLYATERHPVTLLQTSIRQVVQATSNNLDQYDDFLRSLLQVGEGLIRAEAVCAFVELEERRVPITGASGTLTNGLQAALRTLAQELMQQQQPLTGVLQDLTALQDQIPEHLRSYYFASKEIPFAEKASGIVYALNSIPFAEDQLTFLHTIAEQVGVGINNMRQSANIARLLIEMSNVSYVAETIASTFDAQKIFSNINQAASHALGLPIVFCGWLEEDGSLRIIPETAVGLTEYMEKRLTLTCNHAVIRQVLKTHKPLTSRSIAGQMPRPFPTLADAGVKDWACLPMTVKAEVRGIMLAADMQARDFSTREIALLFTYANQAALAMNNSLLYEHVVSRQTQQMESLLNFMHIVSSTDDAQVVERELLRAACAEVSVPAAILSRRKPFAEVQQILEVVGMDSARLSEVEFAPGEGIIGSAAQWKTAIVSLNLSGDGRCPVLRELARQEGFTSSLTVPLIAHDQVLGTLTVLSRETHEFTSAQQHLLQSLGIIAAMALHAVTLVEPEVISQSLRRDIMQHSVTLLSFTADLLDLAQRTEPGTRGMARMKQRLEVMAAVQGELVETHPTQADVKGAILRLREFWLALAGEASPTIRVEGTRVLLPDRQALALAILLHEWVAGSVERMAPGATGEVVLTFQQFFRDIWVQCEIEGGQPSIRALCNPGILEFADFLLNGTLEEHREQEHLLIRYHFLAPDV